MKTYTLGEIKSIKETIEANGLIPTIDELIEQIESSEAFEEGFAVKSSEATEEEINESGRLNYEDKANS